MRLIYRAVLSHFQTHWSSQGNFWAGVLGMLVNNSLTLLGIWAMLFAGKAGLDSARDSFLVMNFILMFAWGIIHIVFGGIADLDTQINGGGLDLAMTAPRNPFLVLSLTASHLPAWGDLILGFVGLVAYSYKLQWTFFFHAMAISFFATIALYAIFLCIGALAFWFRRTEAAHSVILNMCLAFNTYPIYGAGQGARWTIFFFPLLLIGVLPASYVLHPSLQELGVECVGSIVLFILAKQLFWFGLKRYQSCSILGLERS